MVDTKKRSTTLQHACSKFGSDFDFSLFEQAWTSDDENKRLLAYSGVQKAGYENAVNGAVKIAQEPCELEGWTPAEVRSRSQLRL